MLLAYTQTFHKRRASPQYATHTRPSITTILPSRHAISGICFVSYSKKIHSSSMEKIISKFMGTKMAVAFANIFMNEVETKMLNKSKIKPIVWKRYIDDVFSLWDVPKRDIDLFIQQAHAFHPTIKFTSEISEKEITFLDTTVYKGERFNKESILDIKTHYKPTETFQYAHYSSCHPPGVKRGFIKGEAIRLLRTNSSEINFQEAISSFKTRLQTRGYPKQLVDKTVSEVTFAGRQSALHKQNRKTDEKIMPFVTTFHPGVKKLKQILMQKWSFIQNQPLLKTIFRTPPINNILQKRKVAQRHACQSQNLKANITRIATAKPHRGVCVGLSSSFQFFRR